MFFHRYPLTWHPVRVCVCVRACMHVCVIEQSFGVKVTKVKVKIIFFLSIKYDHMSQCACKHYL